MGLPMDRKRRLLIDTDTASDDAVALIMALRSPEVEVLGITVVAGNVPLEQATSNALYTAELCGATVPVFRGAAQPLVRKLEIADWFHGRDGLGDHGYAPARRQAESDHATDAMIRIIRANPGIEIITLGPLTNLALALRHDPGLVENVSRCVVMGGAPCCEGNVTPAAEFNIWVDPEAARVVFRSGIPVEMIGWQLSRGAAVVHEDDVAAIVHLGTPFAQFAIRSNSFAVDAYFKQTGERGISLPDPVAMAIMLDPRLCRLSSEHYVEIETSSELTRGMTVIDRLNVAGDPRNEKVWAAAVEQGRKIRICWELDIAGWKTAILRGLG
jgi:purine nucleosidase